MTEVKTKTVGPGDTTKPICPKCKSDQVVRDAWAEWCSATGGWVLRTTFDHFVCDPWTPSADERHSGIGSNNWSRIVRHHRNGRSIRRFHAGQRSAQRARFRAVHLPQQKLFLEDRLLQRRSQRRIRGPLRSDTNTSRTDNHARRRILTKTPAKKLGYFFLDQVGTAHSRRRSWSSTPHCKFIEAAVGAVDPVSLTLEIRRLQHRKLAA